MRMPDEGITSSKAQGIGKKKISHYSFSRNFSGLNSLKEKNLDFP